MQTLLIISFSYLIGSIPSGFLAGKWILGIDLREIGSGSTGATNVLRHVGKKAALAVFLIDVFKGMFAIIIAKVFSLEDNLQVTAGLASLIGHIWPVWLKGKGGKAVATGLGMFLGISWPVGLATLGVFSISFFSSKIVSISSILAAISLPFLMAIYIQETNISHPYLFISLLAMFIVLWRHRSNMKRLLEGKEPTINQSKGNQDNSLQ